MKCTARWLLAFALACGAAGAWGEPTERAVKPGEVFGGKAIRVLAPSGEGWLVRQTANLIVFGRRGASKRESFVASVSFFDLPESESASPEAFLAFIRKQADADVPPERFEGATASYAYGEESGTACVKYVASALDKKAPGGALTQAMHAFYCKYARRAGVGYAVVYSQRAKAIDADLGERASEFFAGVEVPVD
jgi:hypothetical protein